MEVELFFILYVLMIYLQMSSTLMFWMINTYSAYDFTNKASAILK